MADGSLDFSIVVALYEQPETFRLLLQALLGQVTSATFEIIVCDDGSSTAVFASLRDLIQAASVPIYWIWQQDLGFNVAASTNNGLRQARGDYVVFLDGDMVPERDFLQKHLEAHRGDARIVSGTRSWRSLPLLLESGSKDAAAVWHWLDNDPRGGQTFRHIEFLESKAKARSITDGRPWLAFWTCNLSVPRSRAGLFDEFFSGWGCQDTELVYRLMAGEGLEPIYREDIVAYHLSNRDNNPEMTRRHDDIVPYLRNLCYLVDKWPKLAESFHDLSVPYVLDATSDQWQVAPLFKRLDFPIILGVMRDWLARHDVYRGIASKTAGISPA